MSRAFIGIPGIIVSQFSPTLRSQNKKETQTMRHTMLTPNPRSAQADD
jgi:hypothetical protein